MAENATVNIPNDVIEPIVRAQVTAGIIAALGHPEQLIAQVVDQALKQKVSSKGVVGDRYDNKHDLIEVLARNAIHDMTRAALSAWVEQQRPKIEEHVRKALARKESAFAKALVDGLVSATKSTWNFSCSIQIKE